MTKINFIFLRYKMDINKYRLFGIRLFDLILSLVVMVIIFLLAWKYHFKNLKYQNFVLAAVLLTIPLGIIAHVIFGINTQLNYDLGFSGKPSGSQS